MKKCAMTGLLILALGAGYVSANHKAKVTKPGAANKLAAQSVPISGGSTVSSSGAVSGGTIKKIKSRKRHRAPRRHIKKS